MHILATITTALLLTSATLANPITPTNPLSKRQSDVVCGPKDYYPSSVSAAIDAACNYLQSGTDVDSYPHEYNNYEGFEFSCSGTFYEFPLQYGSAYDGGSPGADRVIINYNCQYCGSITHYGADGNDFVGCEGTST
ncbi:MAG: hypothetical protein M1831_001537 [Alyxoria varia]|nr:MAG: hypothetical protein M1831_001537 [Alyxoria varia]